MAHPDLQHAFAFGAFEIFDSFEKLRVVACAHFRITELSLGAAFNLAAKLHGHSL